MGLNIEGEGMVERVASALRREALLASAEQARGKLISDGEYQTRLARSAIEAMREPTEAMVEASGAGDDPDFHVNDLRNAWRSMIDAALSSTGADR